jgi:hypothetical protein
MSVAVYLQMVSSVVGVLGLAAFAALYFSHKRHQAAIERLDDRLAHLIAGVSLLTDTTEGGLRDVALEVGRLAGTGTPARPRVRATQKRIATAVKRGRTVQEIAATEEVSEGEVRLHLQLEKMQQGSMDAALY